MKINKQLLRVILITIVIVACNSCICQAAGTLPNLGMYQPNVENGKLIEITEIVLGAIIVIGGILITVFIAVTGLGMVVGSAEEKAVAKEKFGGYLIAVVILTGGAAIAKIIISVAGTMG